MRFMDWVMDNVLFIGFDFAMWLADKAESISGSALCGFGAIILFLPVIGFLIVAGYFLGGLAMIGAGILGIAAFPFLAIWKVVTR